MEITFGSRVTMHFSLKLSNGLVVESSFGDEPLSFTLGDGTVDRGLELALIGLREGEHQRLTLMPGQAFGVRDEDAIEMIERSCFPADMQLSPGQIVGFSGPDGQETAGAVLEVGDREVKMDFNHPLAGRVIEFETQILQVEDPDSSAAG